LWKALWKPGSLSKNVPNYDLGGKEITCRRHAYQAEKQDGEYKWESPRPKICSDIESVAKMFKFFLTPGCAITFYYSDEDANYWLLET